MPPVEETMHQDLLIMDERSVLCAAHLLCLGHVERKAERSLINAHLKRGRGEHSHYTRELEIVEEVGERR